MAYADMTFGTGAAPPALADYVGLPITQALPAVVAALGRHGLRARIAVFASGKLITPDKVAWALCLGATAVSSARGPMFALGCIQSLKCETGNCPTGVTAANPWFVQGLDPTDKSVRLAAYLARLRAEVEMIAHACGLREPSGFEPRHVTEVEAGVAGFRTEE
jgi:glutamate synthase domain-containing protein 2